MGQRLMLMLAWIGSLYGDYLLMFSGDVEFELTIVFAEAILIGFKVIGAMWLYKDILGKDKFENPEGLSLKRKKK